MDIFVNGALPLSLVVIMLSLGIGLTLDDFKRVMIRPGAFAIGAGAQIVFVPLMAYLMILVFGITGELAVGIMLLSLCPGGVPTNIATKIAKGDVALSVSLTAVVSLLNIVTVPFVASWSVIHFMGAKAPEVTITGLALAVFVVTTIPVLLGITVRYLRPAFSIRIEPTFSLIGAGLFAIIVVAALFSGWDTFTANISKLGPILVTLCLSLLIMGLLVAKASGLARKEVKTVSIEAGLQNATVGIALASFVSTQSGGFSDMGLPSAVYGIVMYIVVAPFVFWYRKT